MKILYYPTLGWGQYGEGSKPVKHGSAKWYPVWAWKKNYKKKICKYLLLTTTQSYIYLQVLGCDTVVKEVG